MSQQIIRNLYENATSPVHKYRLALLLNEDLGQDWFDKLYDSKWIKLLRDNQNEDGGFGRFHSQNSKVKQKYSTTEKAIESVNILGLRRGNELVDKLCMHMEGILNKEIIWPDGYEKNKWYSAAQPVFVISKLSNFESTDRKYFEKCEMWLEILTETFKGEKYDPYLVDACSEKIIGCQIHGSYIGLNSIYLIELFANLSKYINKDVQEKYLKWLYCDDVMIHYAGVNLRDFCHLDISILYRLLFHLSKFEVFHSMFFDEIKTLEKKYCINGFWDFGNEFKVQKLSDNWREKQKRILDHSILAWVAKL